MKKQVLCLKYGSKYSSEYVNKLYNTVSRNLILEHEFVCLTEDPTGLNKNIKILPLQQNKEIDGWWYKPMVFNPELPLSGTVLFLDLDVVIFDNIDYLFTYEPKSFCIIEDYYAKRKGKTGMNSSCFRFEHGTNTNIYFDFMKNSKKIMQSMHGDQDWIQMSIKSNYKYWPNSWIKSFKWEMHDEKEIIKNGNTYLVNTNPRIDKDTSIAVFHGHPKPHEIEQTWCKNNWR
jgi:hypothetical protein